MDIRLQFGTDAVNWDSVVGILQKANMANYSSDLHQTAFENSRAVVFVFDGDNLIGFGRAISDGAYQAAIYDVAVLPEYQGRGIGKMIVGHIVNKLPNCSFILYASPGKEEFYRRMDFRKMNTGMALFANAGRMKENGFTD